MNYNTNYQYLPDSASSRALMFFATEKERTKMKGIKCKKATFSSPSLAGQHHKWTLHLVLKQKGHCLIYYKIVPFPDLDRCSEKNTHLKIITNLSWVCIKTAYLLYLALSSAFFCTGNFC